MATSKKVQINLSPSSSELRISVSDELAGVLDKIVRNNADQVFLIVPKDAYIAQNVINFQLLKRESESVGKEIVVVSEDPRIQKLAEKVSLATQEGIEEGPKEQKPKPIVRRPEKGGVRQVTDIIAKTSEEETVTDLRSLAKDKEEGALEKELPKERYSMKDLKRTEEKPEPEEKVEEAVDDTAEDLGEKFSVSEYSAEENKEKNKARGIIKPKKMLSGGLSFASWMKKHALKTSIALGAIALAAGAYYLVAIVLPKATITLYPQTTQDVMEFALLADSNISSANFEKATIPAQVIEEKQERTFTFQATGSANIEEYATGKIRVYNEYSSSPQTLVASTRFVSANGDLFRTTETIVVPGAAINGGKIIPSSIEVSVQATEPGEKYNIGPTTFSIPGFKGTDKYLNFYGKSESQMTGGFKGVATIVTQEDTDNAKKKIESEFLPEVSQELRGKIPQSLMVLEDAFENKIETIEFDASVNDRKESFVVRVVAVAQAFLVSEEDMDNTIQRHFINSTEYSKDYKLSDNRSIEYFVKEVDYEKGYVEFNTKVDQMFVREVSTDNLVEEIKGRNEAEVRRILSKASGLEKAQVRFWPFWVKKVPSTVEDIDIEINYGLAIEGQ